MSRAPVVVVTDSPFPTLEPSREILSEIGAELCILESASEESIRAATTSADAVLVTYAKISAAAIEGMKRCRIISRFGIGVDNVDIPSATRAGIRVTRIPDYCIDEVSDHTMALILALARRVVLANAMVHSGRWQMSATVPIHRVGCAVLGLVGFGRISKLVAAKAKVFGMKVISCDPQVSAETMAREGVEHVEFDVLLECSDYVSIHSPLLPETKHLFGEAAFRKMKSTAYIINTARGPIIDEAALTKALDDGQISGAALDVLSQEPPSNSTLTGRENVILTPHMSFYSEESLLDLQKRAAAEVVLALRGEPSSNGVNAV